MIVVLVGPIRQWWGEWHSLRHLAYLAWFDAVRNALVEKGHLVYSSRPAFAGEWDERAQAVNDKAIEVADVVVCLRPTDADLVAVGTDEEIGRCISLGKPVVLAPPATSEVGLRNVLVGVALAGEGRFDFPGMRVIR